MKTKKLFLGLFALILVLSLVNCSDETEDIQPANDITTNVTPKDGFNNKSTQNPISEYLDYLGVAHNNALDEVGNVSGFPNITDSQIIDALDDYYTNLWTGFTPPTGVITSPTNDDKTVEEILDAEGFSVTTVAFGEDIDGYIVEFLSNNSYDDADLADDLASLEETIYNSSIATRDKDVLIGTCVLARYSFAYWTDAENNSSNPWYGSGQGISVDNGNLPALYDDAILDSGAGSSDFVLSARGVWDMIRFLQWGSDCNDSWSPGDCFDDVGYAATAASSTLS